MKSELRVRTILHSIYEWNAARYDQVGRFGVTADLLREELAELENSSTVREACDAYADIFFVAMGGCWKVGLTVDEVMKMPIHPIHPIHPIPPLNFWVEWFIQDPSANALRAIADAVLNTLQDWLGIETALEILQAICDSNHSKEIEKTAFNVKANIEKGLGYISPAEELDRILTERGINPTEELDKILIGEESHEHTQE